MVACLAALGCLAGLVIAARGKPPVGPKALSLPTAWPAGPPTPAVGSPAASRSRLGALSWPADGVSAAFIGGLGVTDGPGATRPVPIASVAKLMRPRAARLRAFFRAAGCALGEG